MSKDKKKICVYGLGGVGGYLGGMLAHGANQSDNEEYKVYFIARGRHLEAIKNEGLTLVTPSKGSISCHPVKSVEKVNELPVMDYVIVGVKGYDLEEAVANINGIADDNTVVIAPLNGVDIYERIRSKLERGTVLPSCIFVTSSIEAPGVVVHKGGTTKLVLGKDPNNKEYDPKDLHQILKIAGIPYKWVDDALPTIWEKYIMFAPFALVTAYSGKTFGEVMENAELKKLIEEIMEEVVELARAKGIDVKDSLIETYLGNASFYPYETKTSYQRDIESGKGKDEGDLIGGTIIRLGKENGISTSTTEKVYRQAQL
ncbi:ketopantoate reductase family protein [Gudongella sp. DL1XJH-153]|uniref:ketopantoate reductase family protein n=1 Tax=Gudongella sp. DL1XJH-153 TaxID=3409804 RepID=UPI003BB556F4